MAHEREPKLGIWGLALSALFLLSGAAMESQSERQQVEALVKAEWGKPRAAIPAPKSFDQYVSWQYAISPPVPASWPPDGSGLLYFYAFAYGANPTRLADGQFVAAPWARVRVDATGKSAPKLEILRKDIKGVGIQGVRPLTQDQITVLKTGSECEAQMFKLSQGTSLPIADTEALRSCFTLWCATHGTVVEQLRPLHKDFFNWIGCK